MLVKVREFKVIGPKVVAPAWLIAMLPPLVFRTISIASAAANCVPAWTVRAAVESPAIPVQP